MLVAAVGAVVWGVFQVERPAQVVLDQPAAPTSVPPAAAAEGTWVALDYSSADVTGTEAFWSGEEVLIYEEGRDPGAGSAEVLRLDPSNGVLTRVPPYLEGAGVQPGWHGGDVAWTGRELVLWGLAPNTVAMAQGAALDLASGQWRGFVNSPIAPDAPKPPSSSGWFGDAVWTGDHLLVWQLGIGFQPDSGNWRAVAPAPLAPRHRAAEVWTGEQLLVWGGCDLAVPQCDDQISGDELPDGAVYDVASDSWAMLAASPLAPRDRPVAVWTGTEMLVWGGNVDPTRPGAYGAAYDPATRQWRTLAEAPIGDRSNMAAVWSGAELLVWGGATRTGVFLGDGAAYDPVTDVWRLLPRSPLSPRDRVAAVWTGDAMVIMGGCCPGGGSAAYRPGGRPEPVDGAQPSAAPGQALESRPPVASESGAPAAVPTEAATMDGQPLLAAESTGGLVELDPATGQILRSFEAGRGEGTAPLSVAPGGEEVYLSRIRTGCWTELVRVPLDGAPEEVLGPGEAPAVSPDGRLLAFLRGDPCSIDDLVLTVRDLATGEEWPATRAQEGHRLTGTPAWAEDSSRLVITTRPVEPTGEPVGPPRVVVVNALKQPPVEARPENEIGPDDQIGGPDDHTIGWAAPTFAGADLLVVEHCCDVVNGEDDVETSRVLAVDPFTGIVMRTVLDFDGVLTWLEADATGEHVLLVATAPEVDGLSGQQDRLLVLTTATGAIRPLRDDIETASW